jgi:hypothetical protein
MVGAFRQYAGIVQFISWYGTCLKRFRTITVQPQQEKNIMKKLLAIAAMAIMLCLSGLVMTGMAFAQQCVDNGDGTVTDNSYGLMWQKATVDRMPWDDAMSYASSLSLGGHSGWQLPSTDELLNLYRSPCRYMMEVVSSNYWSSTTFANHTSIAWRVNFNDGSVYNYPKSNSFYVRTVRAGQ